VSFVADELKAVFDPRGGAWMQGRYVPSLLAAIGEINERHIGRTAHAPAPARDPAPEATAGAHRPCAACPQCGAWAMIRAEGCDKCLDCGYSKCG
jgi:ribonucleoside-diphosphate reductase alpha chain